MELWKLFEEAHTAAILNPGRQGCMSGDSDPNNDAS